MFSTTYGNNFNDQKKNSSNIFLSFIMMNILERVVKMAAKRNRTLGDWLSPGLFNSSKNMVVPEGIFWLRCPEMQFIQYNKKNLGFSFNQLRNNIFHQVFNELQLAWCGIYNTIYTVWFILSWNKNHFGPKRVGRCSMDGFFIWMLYLSAFNEYSIKLQF